MFHSIMIAPGTGPWLSKTRSDISTEPVWPGVPTFQKARGLVWSPKLEPVAMIIGKHSPVIFKFVGTLMVLEIR